VLSRAGRDRSRGQLGVWAGGGPCHSHSQET
jgi:hypothetical protein